MRIIQLENKNGTFSNINVAICSYSEEYDTYFIVYYDNNTPKALPILAEDNVIKVNSFYDLKMINNLLREGITNNIKKKSIYDLSKLPNKLYFSKEEVKLENKKEKRKLNIYIYETNGKVGYFITEEDALEHGIIGEADLNPGKIKLEAVDLKNLEDNDHLDIKYKRFLVEEVIEKKVDNDIKTIYVGPHSYVNYKNNKFEVGNNLFIAADLYSEVFKKPSSGKSIIKSGNEQELLVTISPEEEEDIKSKYTINYQKLFEKDEKLSYADLDPRRQLSMLIELYSKEKINKTDLYNSIKDLKKLLLLTSDYKDKVDETIINKIDAVADSIIKM